MDHVYNNSMGEITLNNINQKWPETGYGFQPSIITLLGVFKRQRFSMRVKIFDAQMYLHLITQIMKNAKKRLDNLCFFDPKLVFF